jgi:hypothetical protein
MSDKQQASPRQIKEPEQLSQQLTKSIIKTDTQDVKQYALELIYQNCIPKNCMHLPIK